VRGVFAGNYGTGQEILGLNIVGNTFEGCWNHGVYSTGCRGASVTGNTFNRCEVPVALTGPYNTITGNGMYSKFTAESDLRDITGISLRNPIGCIVANNTIKGDAPVSSVIVDLQALTAGVTISDNIVANNVIEVAGGSSIAIRINSIATTTADNLVEGNIIRTIGRPNFGAIQVNGTDGGSHLNNVVRDNLISVHGESHGVSVTYQTGCAVEGNKTRFEYDAPSAKTLAAVLLTKCVDTTVDNNLLTNTSAWGTNVTLRHILEQTAGSSGNSSSGNRSSVSLAKLAAFTDFVPLAGSGFIMNESGNGVPAYPAATGSMWRRKDGGATTTLYIRETSAGTTWVAK
jgi:parallel beta-helix repeat protein